MSARRIRYLALGVLVVLALLALAFLVSIKLGEYTLTDLLLLLSRLLESYRLAGYGIFMLTFFIVSMLAVIPLSPIAMLGGALYGVPMGFLLSSVATLLSSVAAFVLSRHALRAPIHRWLSHHLVLARIDDEIARRGWHFVLILRLSPLVPFGLGSYALGLTTVRLRAFLFGTLGALPALFALVYAGSLSGMAISFMLGAKAMPRPIELALFVAGLIFTVVMLMYFTHIARKAIRMDHLKAPAAETADK
ncbi:MAG: VTT domain-containing protein [Methylococcales bacterium]|nr:VTT domain-containing protein [Methylococcales bacterium]